MPIRAVNQDYAMPCRVAVVQWSKPDGIADALVAALSELGHQPDLLSHAAPYLPTPILCLALPILATICQWQSALLPANPMIDQC